MTARLATKRSSYYWSPRLAAAFVILAPASLHKIDFRAVFDKGLSLGAYKSSPAYAALEDIRNNYDTSASPEPKSGYIKLAAGTVSNVQLDESRVRIISLEGLVVRSARPDEPRPFRVAGESPVRQMKPVSIMANGQLLPMSVRKEVLRRQYEEEGIKILSASPAALAEKLVRSELVAAPTQGADERRIPTHTGQSILVAGQTPPAPPSPEAEQPSPTTEVANLSAVKSNPEQLRPLWLTGQVEMTGGLAWVGHQTRLRLRRIHRGETHEKGQIWITEGRFEIYVKSAEGVLLAELESTEGRIIGRGEYNLVQLKDIPSKGNRVEDLRISLRPTTEGAAIRAVSGYSYGQRMMPVPTAKVSVEGYTDAQKVNDEGVVADSSLRRDSSFVVQAEAPGHWPSLSVAQAARAQDVRLYSKDMIQALINLTNEAKMDRRESEEMAIVWGRVTREGKEVAGVQVQMAGAYKPIYINDNYIPDMNLTSTSTTGLFAFLRVKAGVQAVRPKIEGKTYPAQIFPTENGHISYVEMDLAENLVTRFDVVDALTREQAPAARIRMLGSEEFASVDPDSLLEYANGANPFMVEVEAGFDYEVSRMTLVGHPHDVAVPLVRRTWLANLITKNNLLILPGRGFVVGYVDEGGYDVEMTGYQRDERNQIFYFDANGEIVPSKTGVVGGGFIIVNAPVGLQTLFIHPRGGQQVLSQVVVAEPEYVHVVVHSSAATD
ncbi:MAG: hypothetical protein AB7F86_16145 [Bdellovibrionales bacterium]